MLDAAELAAVVSLPMVFSQSKVALKPEEPTEEQQRLIRKRKPENP
jgi:hypothetical protein